MRESTEWKKRGGLQRCRCSNDRDAGNEKFTVYHAPMRNPDDVEPRPAILKPALGHEIEFLRFQAEHLRANHKLRTSLLLFYQIIKCSHISPIPQHDCQS